MTKRNLTILHTESSTGWAGQEMRIILEAREMKKLGYRIIIAVQPGSGIIPAIDREGFEKKILNMRKKDFIISIIYLMKTIAKYKVDIVSTHSSWDSWIASIAARASRRRPIILRTRHLSTPISKGILSRIVYQYLPHLIITTGNSIRETLININHFPENKIISIPTGVDLNVFYPRPMNNTLRAELGISQEEKAIGTIAALRSWKGHNYLLEAAKILIERRKGVKFVIVGDGPRYTHLIEKAVSLGIKDWVLFLGYRDDINDVLSALDMVVLPSYANEGVPQAILQAMAMEKPVIACNTGSIPEVTHDRETGILVEPKNSQALAESIALLLDTPDICSKVAINAKKFIESEYSLKNMVVKIEKVYNSFIQKFNA